MPFSIQTNVNSLIAQENLRVNSNFQSQTIQRLTSGYRINSSADDAAGLAIANKYRSDTAELNQGVRNANDGISQLQIIDGGMNNVSKMLDRLRTLATQSSSATFSDDGRKVADSEFQGLLKEIDRQAQAIGLDTNGQFAKALSVFVGGGKAAGTGANSTDNGEVTVDLSASAVDTRSLGLKGMQAVGGANDIGNSSAGAKVADIVHNAANTTQVAGFTDLYFAGPGFSDGSKVKVSVNLSSVTDMSSLVAAVNDAIQNAGKGDSQAATLFKNAGIVASAVNNGTQLGFTSSTTAFQVQAGDRMANALLGNGDASTGVGTAISSSLAGGNTLASVATINSTLGANIDVHGKSLNVTVNGVTTLVNFQNGSTTTAAAASDINAAGAAHGFAAVYANGALTITGTGADGKNISVSDVAGGTAATTLGINGASASNAFDPSNVTLQITGGGLTSPKNITFSAATNNVSAAIAELQNKVSSDVDLKAAGITVSGSAGGPVSFSSYRGENFSVSVTGDTNNALGFGAFTTNVSSGSFAPDYTSIAGGSAYTPSASYGTASLEFSINGASTASNRVSVDLSAGDAKATVATAASAADVEGGKMSIAVAGGSLNSGAVEVDFGTDTKASVTGNTATTAAGKSLTINIDGVTKTVNFAAATGAQSTIASSSTWANAAGQTLTWAAGGGSGTITFADKAATGSSAIATWGSGPGTDTLHYDTGTGGAAGDVVFDTPADVYAAAGQINAQAGADLYANVDSSGNLVITSKNLGSNTLTFSSQGATDLGIASGYNNGTAAAPLTINDVAAQITAGAGTYINAQVDGSSNLVLTNKTTGSAAAMTLSGAAALTNLGTITPGSDGDNTLTKVINAITAQDGRVTAADNGSGSLQITDNTAFTGVDHTMTLGNGAGNAATALGLNTTAQTSTHGADTSLQQAAKINSTAGIEVNATVDSNGKLVLTALDKGAHAITVANVAGGVGNASTALGFTTTTAGLGRSAQSVVDQLNNLFSQDTALQQAGLKASQSGGTITFSSNNNTNFRLGTAGSAATADLGFGVAKSSTLFSGATPSDPSAGHMSSVDAGGASSTNAIAYSALANGGDDQALTITANDPSGALQTKTITLQNNATARDGRSLDETINYINTQLQQTNNATLQKIVAVKEYSGGSEKVNFVSSLGAFKVAVGASANTGTDGLNGGAASSEDGNVVGTGSNISIDTMANATSAVSALSQAVTNLGSAQAAVGKGQNQLNYAVNLAQSQISNFSAAESRIRDADVASEAANLTKAQVLQQASIAAMAQANSAPQAVLSLLRG